MRQLEFFISCHLCVFAFPPTTIIFYFYPNGVYFLLKNYFLKISTFRNLSCTTFKLPNVYIESHQQAPFQFMVQFWMWKLWEDS